MKTLKRHIGLILLLPALCAAEAESIYSSNTAAVVTVISYNEEGKPVSQGSGFIARQDGAVITSYHVIGDAKDIRVKVGGRLLSVAGLLCVDIDNDIVILKVEAEGLPTVRLGDSDGLTVGQRVFVISSPEGFENTITEGILSGLRTIDGKSVIQISASISKGSSGGPVFNQKGEVIAVATFFVHEAQNLNFAVPVNVIRGEIAARKVITLESFEAHRLAALWFMLGINYLEAGRYREAANAFKRAIFINPNLAEFHNNLGVAYDELGLHREAIAAYMRAIKLKPDYSKAYVNLGITYGKLGIYKKALEAYKKATHLEPGFAEAHFNLGLIYIILNDKGSAMEEYDRLLALDREMAARLLVLIKK